jgi:hypothetical protein
VERLHKTMRAEFLRAADGQYATIEDLQHAFDAWVVHYNTQRPHQALGMRPDIDRFALAGDTAAAGGSPGVVDPVPVAIAERRTPAALTGSDAVSGPPRPRLAGVQRWVDPRGLIRLAGFTYRVPIVLAGEPVEAVVANNLVEIYHREVLVASHVQHRSLSSFLCK